MNKLATSIEIPRQLIDHMTFSPDGRMLVASRARKAPPPGTLALANDYRQICRFADRLPYAFSPDGGKLSGVGGGMTIAEWDVASFAEL